MLWMNEKKLNEKGTWEEGIRSQNVRTEFPTNELCRLTFAYRAPATTATVFLSRPRSLARSLAGSALARSPSPRQKHCSYPNRSQETAGWKRTTARTRSTLVDSTYYLPRILDLFATVLLIIKSSLNRPFLFFLGLLLLFSVLPPHPPPAP
jgi:hypothetical protein